MSSLTLDHSIDQISEEYLFTRTLLDSLDPSSDDYEAQKQAFAATLHHLEELLQAKQGDSLDHFSDGNEQQYPEASTVITTNGLGSDGQEDDFTTPNGNAPMYPTPSGLNGPSGHLKRPREPSFSGGYNGFENKSRRTTPDTEFSSLSSNDSFERLTRNVENRYGSAFPSSQSQSSQYLMDRRRMAEEAEYERRNQLRADEEMARALEQVNAGVPMPALGSTTWRGYGSTNSIVNSNRSISGNDPTTFAAPSHYSGTPDQGAIYSNVAPIKAEATPSMPSRYDRPIPYHSSPTTEMSDSDVTFGRSASHLPKQETFQMNPSLQTNRGTAEVVDLTGMSSSDEDSPIETGANYSLGPMATYGSMQNTQYNAPNDPFADLNQHQQYLTQYAHNHAIPGAYDNAIDLDPMTFQDQSLYSQASQLISGSMNGLSRFGQAIGNFAGQVNPFSSLNNGHVGSSQFGGLVSSSYPYGMSALAGQGHAGPSNTTSIDPMDDLLNFPNRHRLDYLINDPTKSREEINALLANISADDDLPPQLRGETPDAMATSLLPHQLLGLKWLKKMEEGSNRGGILADDMGLGKTIQALALMVTRKSEDPRCKTTLIVAPVALLRQWKREIEVRIKTGKHALSTLIYHGQMRPMKFNDLKKYDVVLTTFGKLGQELKRQRKYEFRLKSDPNATRRRDEQVTLLEDDSKWYRVIIDEAQCIKNRNTQVSTAACMLEAKYRFCMTGTPMMNNVEELYSLIRFLRIKPYCDWDDFRTDFVTPLKSSWRGEKDKAMQKLQALLKAILLRRTKTSKIDGKPIINIPERSVEAQHAVFSEDEQQVYSALEQNTQLTFNKYLKAGTVGKNYSNMLTLLLRLRQCCCHPHLMKDWSVSAEQVSDNPDGMVDLASSLDEAVVKRIKDTNGSFECPVCYDAVENPAIFVPCGHDTCMECFASLSDPSRAIAAGDEGASAKCPECRGTIKRSALIDYKTFRRVHMPETMPEEEREGTAQQDDDETDSDSDDTSSEDSDEVDDRGNLKDFIADDDDEEEAQSTGDEDAEPSKTAKEKKRGRPKKSAKAKGKQRAQKKAQTLAELKKAGMRNAEAKRKYLKKLRKDYITSSKLTRTIEILREVKENDPKEKTIIFSQWTSLLDLLEIAISGEKEALGSYTRYDGSMNANARNVAVNDFLGKPQYKIMLVSLKAGNAGLNLTAASQVIILDPFWNPFIEEQAIDRAHRIGQSRPVQVHKVLVKGTVEDRIVELQERKRELITTALDEGESKKVGRLSTGELAYLFGVSRNPNETAPSAR
ncbi:MAG: hypothetical protein M1820_006255 [Bogoriella megaspora]|nr:MAG: hypothetical protein M1820_006255 [Bogoriella megaspora]